MASSPRYVLSARAAAALRELIAPGGAYGSRRRPAHNAQSVDLRELFRVRRVVERGEDPETHEPTEETHLLIYLVSAAAVSLAVRINGRATDADLSGLTLADGWADLGDEAGIGGIWIQPALPASATATTADLATNWSSDRVRVEIVTTSSTDPPPAPTGTPTGLDADRYLHPVPIWAQLAGVGYQLHVGVVESSIEIGDDDGTHSGAPTTSGYPAAGGFRSVVQEGRRALGLADFRAPSLLAPEAATADGGPQIVLRIPGSIGSAACARVGYVVFAEIVAMLRQSVGDDLLAWLADPGNLDALAAILADEFDADKLWWPRGGDETVCYGSAIGDAAGRTKVIDLNGKILVGPWKTDDDFSVGDNANAADLTVNGDASVTGDLTVTGKAAVTGNANVAAAPSVTGHGDFSDEVIAHNGVRADSLYVIANWIKLNNGDTYAPQQITYVDAAQQSHTVTILVKQ